VPRGPIPALASRSQRSEFPPKPGLGPTKQGVFHGPKKNRRIFVFSLLRLPGPIRKYRLTEADGTVETPERKLRKSGGKAGRVR
jgi:hypothetical protein